MPISLSLFFMTLALTGIVWVRVRTRPGKARSAGTLTAVGVMMIPAVVIAANRAFAIPRPDHQLVWASALVLAGFAGFTLVLFRLVKET